MLGLRERDGNFGRVLIGGLRVEFSREVTQAMLDLTVYHSLVPHLTRFTFS